MRKISVIHYDYSALPTAAMDKSELLSRKGRQQTRRVKIKFKTHTSSSSNGGGAREVPILILFFLSDGSSVISVYHAKSIANATARTQAAILWEAWSEFVHFVHGLLRKETQNIKRTFEGISNTFCSYSYARIFSYLLYVISRLFCTNYLILPCKSELILGSINCVDCVIHMILYGYMRLPPHLPNSIHNYATCICY